MDVLKVVPQGLIFSQEAFFETAVTLPVGLKSKIGDQENVAKILKFNHCKHQIDSLTQQRETRGTDSHVKRYPEE